LALVVRANSVEDKRAVLLELRECLEELLIAAPLVWALGVSNRLKPFDFQDNSLYLAPS
jgi:hypothetical protein